MKNLKIAFASGLILFLFLVLPVGLISLMGKQSTRINLNLDANFIETYCLVITRTKKSVAKRFFTFEEATEAKEAKEATEAKEAKEATEAKDFINCIKSVGDRVLRG